jgi:protein Mpv17
MMTFGDVISQQLIEKKGWDGHDTGRSLRMTIYGATIGGPLIGSYVNDYNTNTNKMYT